MKKLLALATILLHIFTFSTLGYADGAIITDASGNVVSQTDGNVTNVNVFGDQSYTCTNCDILDGQTLNINILNALGIADTEARAIFNIADGQASNWAGLLNLFGTAAFINTFGFNIAETFTGNINGGAILSTLGISQEDFFSGMAELARVAGSDPAAIINSGQFNVADNSFLALVASAVQNHGVITANGGAAILAAGDQVTMDISGGSGLISVAIDKSIDAPVYDKDGNKIADAISNSGVIQANGGLAILSARAAESVFDNVINHTGIIEANTVREEAGRIILDGGDEGITRVEGDLYAMGDDVGEVGGSVKVLGDKVGVFGDAILEASGYSGGGEVLIGGNYQGLGSERNASATYVSPDAIVKADAVLEGDGGKIVVWSDGSTRAYGYFSARGGVLNGDGGLIETSGKEFLDVEGARVDASSPSGTGKAGTWLLDPSNLEIRENGSTSSGAFGGGNPDVFTPTGNNSRVLASEIQSRLNAGTNVTITTGLTGSPGNQTGNITWQNAAATITKTLGGNATLTFIAAGSITFGANVSSTVGALNLVIQAVNMTINTGVTLTTNGGNLDATLSGTLDMLGTGAINAGVGIAKFLTGVAAQTIGLGGGAGTLNITDSEIDRVTASSIEIGNSNAGNIIVTNFSPANANKLILRTGGSVNQSVAGGGPNITVQDLGIDSATGVGTGFALEVNATNLAVNNTASGNINITDTAGGLTIGTVSGIVGATNAGGNTTLTANSPLTVNTAVSGTNVTLEAAGATPADILTLNANVDATTTTKLTGGVINQTGGRIASTNLEFNGTAGAVTLGSATNNVTSVAGTSNGDITITDVDDLTVTTVGAQSGLNPGLTNDITINTGNTLTIAQNITANGGGGRVTLNTAAGGVNQTGGAFDINELLLMGTGTYTLTQAGNNIDRLAANVTGNLSFKDGVDAVTVDSINGTNGITTNNGNVNIEALTNLTLNQSVNAGLGAVKLTAQNGGITGGVAVSDVTAGSLEAQSNTGIDLDTVITNLAFNNVGGAVDVRNTGALTVNNVGALATSNNTGTTTTLSAASPVTFAVNTTSAGTLTATAGETGAAGDDLTVNAGVTVKSTGGDVILRAGDDVNLLATSAVQSDVGAVGITAGFADTDNAGNIASAGSVNAATTATLSALKGSINQTGGSILASDLVVSALSNSSLNEATNDVNTLTATTTNDLIFQDADELDLKASTIGGALTLTTNGAITDSGNLAVTGATTLAAGAANDITLDNANNFGSVAITSGKDVTLNDTNAINLDNSTISGFLTITAGGLVDFIGNAATTIAGAMNLTTTAGGINDSGTGSVAVTGTTTLNATGAGNNITLDNANDFGGAVTVTTANDVTLADVNDLTLTNLAVGGAVSLIADSDNNTVGSALTTGTINADSVSLSGGTDLDDIINLNGTVTATAGGVTVQNAATVNLADSVNVEATGGAINATTGVTQIVVGATGTNTFTTNSDHAVNLGAVNGTGANLTVASNGDVTLGDVNIGLAGGNLTVDVDNNDNGGNTGTFGAITSKDLAINGHNATSADENFTFNGPIAIGGDLDMGGVGVLTFNNDVSAKSITIHDISTRVQLGQDTDLTANNGVLHVFTNVASIFLAGAAGLNIFDGNGDSTVNLAPITRMANANLTVNSEGDVTLDTVDIGNGVLTIAVDNDADSTSTGSFGALTAGTIAAGGTSDDNLTFNGAVTANTAGLTISDANDVNFESTINTATGLTQTAGAGTTTFKGLATVGSNADITTGSIAFNGVNGSLNANAGTGAVKLTAQTGGITSGGAASDVTAGSLEAQSNNGIDLDTAITNLAFNNVGGAVDVRNTGALAISNVGALATSNNTGTTTTLSAASPVTFAVNTTSAGTLTATAGETGVAGDDLTVNAGVTVKSTGGDVILRAGDDVNLTATSAVQSDVANVTLIGGFNDLADTFGSVFVGGTVTALASATITALVGSVNGAGLITANTADLDAITGIGNTTALNTAVTNVSADTTNGNIDIDNALATATNATSLTTGIGTINFDQTGGGALTLTNATTGNGTITATNAGADITATNVVAGTVAAADGDVNLTTTGGGNINVGNVSALADTATLNAAGAIRGVTDDNTADVSAGTINLVAAVGGISGAGGAGALDVTATTALNADTITGDDSNITIDSIGNLPVGLVTAGTGQIDVESTGNITDANDGGTADAPAVTNFLGGVINLTALVGGIGTALDAVDFLASTKFSATTTADNSNIFVRSTGDAPIDLINAGTGNVTLTSQGNVTDFNNDTNANIIGGTINLVNVTAAKDIGSLLNYFDIQPATLWNVTTNNSNAFINCIGTCPVGQVDLGTALFAYSGALTDGNDALNGERNGGTWNIKAGGFHAQGGASAIGDAANWIETRLQDPNGVAGDGQLQVDAKGVFISNTGGLGLDANSGLKVTNILPATFGLPPAPAPDLALTDGITSTGGIIIDSNSPLNIDANVLENAGNDIFLSANGTSAVDDVNIATGISVSATGGNGNISVFAGDDVNMAAGSVISAAGTGTVNVGAGEDATNGVVFTEADGNANASLEMDATAAIRSQDGTINIRTTEDARVSEVNANSNADGTLGNINITANTNNNGVGRIEDENGATVNLTGDVATLRAATGIGVDGANTKETLETNINTLDAINTASGHVVIRELAIGGALGILRAFQQGAGDHEITTEDGTLTVLAAGGGGLGVTSTSGETLLQANGAGSDDDLVLNHSVTSTTGKINLDSTSRDVIADANGDVTATTGAEIEVAAQRNVTMADGAVFNANAGGDGTATGGDLGVGIDMDATTGDVTLGSVQTTSTASTSRGDANDAVSINALAGAVIDGGDSSDDIIANVGETQISTANGIGQGNSIDTQIDRLDATNSTANDIDIVETAAGGELNIVRVDQNATTGRVNIQTTNGHLTVLAEAVGGNTGNGVEAVDGETFLIANGGGNDDDLTINNQIESRSGKINVDSTSRDVIASAEGDITATVGAEIESSAARNITMADGAIWNANTGGTGIGQSGAIGVGIDLDALAGDIRLGSVQTTSTAATSRADANDAVDIQALNGAVIDNGDSSDDIIANVGQVMIQAANGIGHGNSIDTQIDRLEINNSTLNDIDIREQVAGGELNLTRIDQNAPVGRIDIQTLDGHLTVLADADVSDLNNYTGVEGLAGEIFLRANGAGANDDLRLFNNTTSTTGKINFDSSSRDVIADANGDADATGGAQIEVDAERHVTMADGTIWNAFGGDGVESIDIDADTGDVTLGSVQTTSTSATAVVISARAGKIIDGGDTDLDIVTGAVTLAGSGSVLPNTGGGMLLRAANGIGSRGTGTNGTAAAAGNFFAPDAIDTQGGRLSARTEAGDIQVHNIGGLEITTLTDGDAPSGQGAIGAGTVVGLHIEDPLAVDPASIIFVTASSPMLVSSVVNNFDGGNISLYAVGGTVGDIMDINANITSADNTVSALSGNGVIRLISGGDMNVAQNVTVATRNDGVTSGTGSIIAGAGFDATGKAADEAKETLIGGLDLITPLDGYKQTNIPVNGGGALVTNALANINMNSNADESVQATFTTENGDIRVDAANNLNLGLLHADGNNGTNGLTDGVRGDVFTNSINGSTLDTLNVGPGSTALNLDILAENLFMYSSGIIGTNANNIETDAPYITTVSINDQFINNTGDVRVNINALAGNVNFRTTGDIFLGTATAERGEVNLQAGDSIFNTTNGTVTANSVIRLIAGGIVGTATNPIDAFLNNAGTLFLGAGSQVNNLSANLRTNFNPTGLEFLGTPPGLVLFNQSSVPGGGTIGDFLENVSTLFVPALAFNNASYGEFDGQNAADFPGYFNMVDFATPPVLSIGTTAIDSIQVIGIQVQGADVPQPIVPVPTEAVQPTETTTVEEVQEAVETVQSSTVEEDTPPTIVPIPEDAGAPAQGTTGDQVQVNA